jgi:hypothetical protein
MDDRVVGDVGDVLVAQGVGDLATAPLGLDHVTGAEHTEVLRDEWLRHAERIDELVDAPRLPVELADDGEAVRAGERPQQLCRSVEPRF